MTIKYFCDTKLHGGKKVPASFVVCEMDKTEPGNNGLFQINYDTSYACCTDHLQAIVQIYSDRSQVVAVRHV